VHNDKALTFEKQYRINSITVSFDHSYANNKILITVAIALVEDSFNCVFFA
jgi:hypothetical protein